MLSCKGKAAWQNGYRMVPSVFAVDLRDHLADSCGRHRPASQKGMYHTSPDQEKIQIQNSKYSFYQRHIAFASLQS